VSLPAWPPPDEGLLFEGARALMTRFDAEVGHGERVLGHGRRLLVGSIDAFDYPERAEVYRLSLDLAALVHDIGHTVSARRHNRHSRYLVLHSDRTQAWPERLRVQVAELAGAHRGSVRPRRLLERLGGERDLLRLAALLRIADGLDRSHVAGVSIVAFGPSRKGFELVVSGLPEVDRRRLRERKADLFARAFDQDLGVRVDLLGGS
jgi:exopolyphosphatase / guanosine-5'-triphosphate,3'-diphosphate pyrophosphatase